MRRTAYAETRLFAEFDPPIGRLVIANAARRNAVNLAMWQAIPEAIRSLDEDPEIRVIIVRGEGDVAFVSGADISEFETVRADAESARAYEAANAAAFSAIRDTQKPTIAMIRGFCMGGGIGIAAACDLRFAGDDAVFAVPAARLGVGYPPEAIRDVVNLVGPSGAKSLFFTAARIDHLAALQVGLIDTVVPAAELEAETDRIAATIAENAPLTLRAAKAAIAAVAGDPAAADWQSVRALADACFDSADYAEGRTAFLEKRRPKFTGA
ncbi:MAG: enoyl-CoA hydratase/isomerase family protein [Hyphomicrobiales bacterium]|nr:enoyl-CoA hydratase/isomerase family protein [Hyphomicrobiales bacterium]